MIALRTAVFAVLVTWGALSFAGGSIEVLAKDSEGKAEGSVALEYWDAQVNDYTRVTSKDLRHGRAFFKVVPGKYRLIIRYTETFPVQMQDMADVIVNEKDEVVLEPMFGKGWSEISTWDNDGGAEGLLFYERWNDESQSYELVTSREIRPRDARKVTPLAPGRYRVTFKNMEQLPNLEYGSAEIEIEGGIINVQQFHTKFGMSADDCKQ